MGNYIMLLIIVPVLFAFLFLIGNNKYYYKVLSWLLFFIESGLSIALVLKGPQRMELSGTAYSMFNGVVLICEAAIILYLLYVSIKNKRWPVLFLVFLQTALSIYSLLHEENTKILYFNADKLSLIMVLIVNIIGTLILLFSNDYMTRYEEHRGMKSRQRLYYFMTASFLSAMNGLVLSDTLSLLYFFWEVTTLVSFILISYNNDTEAINSGFRALLINLFGGLCFSVGIILFEKQMGAYTLTEIMHRGTVSIKLVLPVFLLCIAGFAKSAQVPFQSWLLGAMVAPTPVSALLHSSTMVNAGVYLIVKLSPSYAGTHLGTALAIYGGLSFLICSAIAITQRNAKRILAYSTIANLGLVISSTGMGSSIAVSAAIMLIIFHAISKALLFLCAGEMEHVAGSRDIEDMYGLIDKCPYLASAAVLGMVSMLLPPFGVLVTKWISIEASATNPVVAVFLVMGSALTSVFWIKWIGTILSHNPDSDEKYSLAFLTSFPLTMLGFLILLTTVFIGPIFNLYVSPEVTSLLRKQNDLVIKHGYVSSKFGTFNDTFVFLVLATVFIVYVLVRKLILSQDIKKIYMCGENNAPESSVCFRCGGGDIDRASVSNLYLNNMFTENTIVKIGYVLSSTLIVLVFIGGALCIPF